MGCCMSMDSGELVQCRDTAVGCCLGMGAIKLSRHDCD